MKTYNITIRATITKTYAVEADNEDAAYESANAMFSVLNEDGIDEHYTQEVIDTEEGE
jgi:hypothetical protein